MKKIYLAVLVVLLGINTVDFHSHNGWHYQSLLKMKGIVQSMSHKENCWDNAIIENFFGTLNQNYFVLMRFD